MATPRTDPRNQAGATALNTDDHKSRGPLWILLGLLALLALAALAFLLIRNAADDGDDAGVDTTDDAQAGESGSDVGGDAGDEGSGDQATTTTAAEGGGSSTTAAPSGGAGGELSTAGGAIVPPPAGGLADQVGEEVTGTATVESVVSDEGFWVGQGPGQRVFVMLTPEARTTEGESPFQVEAGQTIEMTGALAAAPADPASLGVEDDEGAAELAEIGAFVEASRIALSE